MASNSNGASSGSDSTSQNFKVDSSHAKTPLWLVKVPKYLATAWENATEEKIGEITITKDPKNQLKISLKLADSLVQGNIIKNYDLPIEAETRQKLAVISQTKTGSAMVMDGHINRRADIRPPTADDKTYMDMTMDRIKKATAPTRVVQYVDRVNTFKPIAAPPITHLKRGRDEPEKDKVEKKMREDKEVVTERLFAAFEKHQYINIRDLAKISNQPMAYLKEILNEICDYNMKGSNKNTWELKPQYRHY